uniref:Ig-like domain-containing protein n=1 Tax=Esox lucius TaxID=8010 RepID=A0AAY5L8M9_ESOLU
TFIESRIYIILPIHLWFPTNTTIILLPVYGTSCLVLECWFVQERPDPAATFCSSSLHPPEGSVQKPHVQWTVSLTDPTHSPFYLQADWYSAALPSHPPMIKMEGHSSTNLMTYIYHEQGVSSLPSYLSLCLPEPPSLSIFPSPLPLSVPGQVVTVQCEASGFSPLSLELHWEIMETDGNVRPLGQGSVSGHRQGPDGTYSQTTRLQLDSAKLDLGRGGEVTCVAVHPGGTRRARVTLNVIDLLLGVIRILITIIHMPFMMGPE